MRHVFVTLALVAIAGLWWYTHGLVPTLPAEIPLHFDAAGKPDRMGPVTALYLLPEVGTAVGVLFIGVSFLVTFLAKRTPGLVNLPNKAQLLALDEAARARALGPMASAFAFFAIAIQGVFLYLTHGTAEIALGHQSALSQVPVLVVVLVTFVGVIVGARATSRAISREAAAQRKG